MLDMLTAENLGSLLDRALPVYVLVDPMLGDPAPGLEPDDQAEYADIAECRRAAWGREIHDVELHHSIKLERRRHPYLVETHSQDQLLLAQSVQLARQGVGAIPHIGGWLQSALDGAALARGLSRAMLVKARPFAQERYMRLADPRALAWLCHVVGTDAVARQFPRLAQWLYADALGGLQRLANEGDSLADLILSEDQWQRFMKSQLVHCTLVRCIDRLPAQSHCSAAYGLIEAALPSADSAARQRPACFKSVEDHAAWTALQVARPGFEHLAAAKRLLDEAAREGNTIQDFAKPLHAAAASLT